MNTLTATNWTPIYIGSIADYRLSCTRKITIEKGGGALLRVLTLDWMTEKEIAISGRTPSELEEKLVTYGRFTDAQAQKIIRAVMFREQEALPKKKLQHPQGS